MEKIRLGISTCLLGEGVRFDGGHKLDRYLRDTLGEYVEWVPVCAEVEFGLPTPRESLRLVRQGEKVRLIFTKSKEDITEPMDAFARERVAALKGAQLSGFVFKAKSPSCGMERVRLYDQNGVPKKEGTGRFAAAFMEAFPLLPVEEEGRLHDPGLRENFIESIFVFSRWREVLEKGAQAGDLVEFHTRHKLLLLAHSEKNYRAMGKLVASAGATPAEELFPLYEQHLSEAMRLLTTPKKHLNVLMHMLGYFKKELTADEKQEALELFDHFKVGDLPLIVPITLMNHYVRKYDKPYLQNQLYLNPHPLELKLRNHS